MKEKLKRRIKEVRVFFETEADTISDMNWSSLRYLTLLYLASLVVYYLIVCIPQAVTLQTKTVMVFILVQIVYSGTVWARTKPPRILVVTAYLMFFATLIAAFAIYLGTFVFPNSSALLFPLLLIMLTQFYTIHPGVSFAMLSLFSATFLIMSGVLKPYSVFQLDLLSTTVAYAISLVSVYTTTKFKVKVSQKQAELNYLTEIDPLTKALNKAGFMKKYKHVAEIAGKNDKIVLAMVDIDDFKSVNDKFGHLFGDKVLQGFSSLMRQYFRVEDTATHIGRFGGDEFVILIEDASTIDEDGAQFRDFINRTEELRAQLNIDSLCSIGVVIAACDPSGPEALIEVADKALYGVKQSGGGDFRIVVL